MCGQQGYMIKGYRYGAFLECNFLPHIWQRGHGVFSLSQLGSLCMAVCVMLGMCCVCNMVQQGFWVCVRSSCVVSAVPLLIFNAVCRFESLAILVQCIAIPTLPPTLLPRARVEADSFEKPLDILQAVQGPELRLSNPSDHCWAACWKFWMVARYCASVGSTGRFFGARLGQHF